MLSGNKKAKRKKITILRRQNNFQDIHPFRSDGKNPALHR